MAKMAFQHQAGTAMECLSVSCKTTPKCFVFTCFYSFNLLYNKYYTQLYYQIPITLQKEAGVDAEGREVMKCGFKIGGGIDQDYRKSPQGYTDNVSTKILIYILPENSLLPL